MSDFVEPSSARSEAGDIRGTRVGSDGAMLDGPASGGGLPSARTRSRRTIRGSALTRTLQQGSVSPYSLPHTVMLGSAVA